ncbi:unnamed protein product [Closterium sp. NIES-64]|nr:unnamed protein product [Closterium sp. NIES-64]CAI5985089.1 unnamed protein product [Closterium sp. NIES-65]
MPRLYHRSQLAVHIKRAICAHHVANPQLRHVDLARWCFTRFGIRPDRSTIGRVLKGAERWVAMATDNNIVCVRGGAHPALERAMAAWIANAGPAEVPLTLVTIRDHVANMAHDIDGVPAEFRCSIGWVRRALRRQGVRCLSAVGEAADQDMAAVRTTREKLPQLLMHLSISARDTYNFDETALNISVFTHFMEQLNAAMYAEERSIVILMDNASSHVLKSEGAETEDLFGFRTRKLNNLRILYLPPNTTCFTQPLDQGIIATAKARYRAHWLSAFTAQWAQNGATSAMARYTANLCNVLAWLLDAWMNIKRRTIQRCWWCTECLPRAWEMQLEHVRNGGNGGAGGNGAAGGNGGPTELDEAVGDVGILINRLGLGPSAMPAAEFVRVDDNQPSCAEPGEDPLAMEPPNVPAPEMWEAPASMQAVYDDANPACREARRYARAASEMLIGYAKATGITPRDLCVLFDIRNPIIRARMERASPPLNLNQTPPPATPVGSTPPAETPRRRGRVLPAWMTAPIPRWVILAQ